MNLFSPDQAAQLQSEFPDTNLAPTIARIEQRAAAGEPIRHALGLARAMLKHVPKRATAFPSVTAPEAWGERSDEATAARGFAAIWTVLGCSHEDYEAAQQRRHAQDGRDSMTGGQETGNG